MFDVIGFYGVEAFTVSSNKEHDNDINVVILKITFVHTIISLVLRSSMRLICVFIQ